MFSLAFQVAQQFTRPLIISKRLFNGKVVSSLGAFIVVNSDGWAVTAAHMFGPFVGTETLSAVHAREQAEYQAKKREVEEYQVLAKKDRDGRRIVVPDTNPEWIVNQAFWWSQDRAIAGETHINTFADVALVKLANFDTSSIKNFPIFKDPNLNPMAGQSMCRLGYPFHAIDADFNQATNQFQMKNFSYPPLFPSDGIHTRIQLVVSVMPPLHAKFIETSTPGLRGQSGGPLFDIKGDVWGIQSRTAHLDLGFKPIVKDDKGNDVTVKERQFMHVGHATHMQHVAELFDKAKVKFPA